MPVKRPRAEAKKQDSGGKAVAAYLAALPQDGRTALQKLRRDIRAAAPEAVELIAWGMPAFKQGRLLVGYAAFKEHCSFFPMSAPVMRQHAAKLKKYETTRGSIHFTATRPLPAALVKRLVEARIAENESRPSLSGRR